MLHLFQITEGIFSPESPELPDIEFKSHGFKDLIKTGFRWNERGDFVFAVSYFLPEMHVMLYSLIHHFLFYCLTQFIHECEQASS